ncbi:MAG: 2OG-Fe(II) oxygenase [Burkholderiaceae bacterium]
MNADNQTLATLPTIDWQLVTNQLDQAGHAVIEGLLTPKSCDALAASYEEPTRFRSKVIMARHGFGRGEYQYFAYPLPSPIQSLRQTLYQPLAVIANQWHERLGIDIRYPENHQAFLEQCHEAGQTKPTPLMLRYGPGDYNCLHQDLYGALAFPLQVVVLLSAPDRDFDGGELVLTEQRPRMQSRPMVISLRQGDAAVIPVNERPVRGTRGDYRVKLRHGVSLIKSGNRHTLGLIFHDAQ